MNKLIVISFLLVLIFNSVHTILPLVVWRGMGKLFRNALNR